MFCICGVYDGSIEKCIREICLQRNILRRNYSRLYETEYYNFDIIESIKVGVYDTTDNSTEWYDLLGLLKIVESSNVEIDGLKLEYYAKYAKMPIKRPSDLATLKRIDIRTTIADADKKFLSTIAKYKMIGIDISMDGILRKFDSRFCKDGVVVLPDEVRDIDYRAFSGFNRRTPLHKLIAGKNLGIWSIQYIRELFNGGDKNIVVFEDDVFIDIDKFKHLYCNIYSRGTLTHSNFNKLIKKVSTSKHGYFVNKNFFLADSKSIYVLDFVNYRTYTTKNDGSIKE